MNQDNSGSESTEHTNLGGKSWTAYVRVAIVGFVLLCIVTPFVWSLSTALGLIALTASLGFVAYQVLVLRSFYLFFDDVGVWVSSGVLPWNTGVAGVKWRDLDGATYTQSMGSWLFKSYSICIGHRFTKSSEIILSNWMHGDQAVFAINDRHAELVRSGALN